MVVDTGTHASKTSPYISSAFCTGIDAINPSIEINLQRIEGGRKRGEHAGPGLALNTCPYCNIIKRQKCELGVGRPYLDVMHARILGCFWTKHPRVEEHVAQEHPTKRCGRHGAKPPPDS